MNDTTLSAKNLAEIRSCSSDWRNVPNVRMLQALLAAYDAQAARLAAVEQSVLAVLATVTPSGTTGVVGMGAWRDMQALVPAHPDG